MPSFDAGEAPRRSTSSLDAISSPVRDAAVGLHAVDVSREIA